jgi:hypothetical protein
MVVGQEAAESMYEIRKEVERVPKQRLSRLYLRLIVCAAEM